MSGGEKPRPGQALSSYTTILSMQLLPSLKERQVPLPCLSKGRRRVPAVSVFFFNNNIFPESPTQSTSYISFKNYVT